MFKCERDHNMPSRVPGEKGERVVSSLGWFSCNFFRGINGYYIGPRVVRFLCSCFFKKFGRGQKL